MSMSGGSDDGEPMMEMNTTPLIDVMLVLLIMFIITIPVATHSVNIDLPSPSVVPPDHVVKTDKNKVVITSADVIQWNGAPTTQGQLVTLLQQSTTLNPEPELQYEAGYDLSAHVLNIIKGSGVTKFGFVHNELYANFNRAAGTAKPN